MTDEQMYRTHDDCCEHERLDDLQSRLSAAEEELERDRGVLFWYWKRRAMRAEEVASAAGRVREAIEGKEQRPNHIWQDQQDLVAAHRRYEEGK